jgi:hypothetical protein
MSPCANGSHVVDDAADPTYVRIAVRLNDENGTYVYLVGGAPDRAVCRPIWCYGERGVPWTCVACGEPIAGPRYRSPNFDSPRAIRRRLLEPFLLAVDPHRELPPTTRRRRAILAMRAFYARREHSR